MSYPAVVIAEYNPEWPLRFEEEKPRILAALGSQALAVEHIGSTSVPGLAAKPIVDIMVGVRSLESAFEVCRAPLQGIGYEHIPMPALWDRRFFSRGIWKVVSHHLHLIEFEGRLWMRYVHFRDHLRAHPEVAREYEQLKRQIAARPGMERPAYSAAKAPFIEGILDQIGALASSGAANR